jgi:nucleoid DNA-binding protein
MSEARFISHQLHRLLPDHDCVVIPGLGGFVCNDRPARYDAAREELIPPAKDMLFNERLIHNDGVLAHELSAASGLSYTEALDLIESESAWMRAALRAGDTVTLAHVGRLFRPTPTEAVVFTPDAELERLFRSFGLQRIPLRPLESAAPATPEIPVAEPAKSQPTISAPVHPMWRRIAAALAVPVVAASAWWGVSQDAELLNFVPEIGWSSESASFIPRFPEEGVFVPEPVETADVNRFATLLGSIGESSRLRYNFIDDRPEPNGTRITAPEPVPDLVPVPVPVPPKFLLVAGAFSVPANAEKLAADARAEGLPGEVRKAANGLDLVTVGAFVSETEAREALESVRAAGKFQIWMKRL